MLLTQRQLILTLAVTLLYFVGQLLTKTGTVTASLFTLAIFFGVFSIFAGGGLRSAIGCLNAILIGKFLLIGIAIKIALLEPADDSLNAPQTTAEVMAVGFFGLFLGTYLQAYLKCPESCSLNRPYNPRMLLAFSLVLFGLSYLAYFASMVASGDGEGIQTGGWLGVAHALASLKALSIVPIMLLMWRVKTRLWMTHPWILGILTWSVLFGILSTAKQEAMEPLVLYALVGFLRYGWWDKRIWCLVSVAVVYYVVVVFPYSQYVRNAGGREGSVESRAGVTSDVFWRIVTNQEFRSTVTERVTKQPTYFNLPLLAPFNRIAMVGEADRLIFATEMQHAFTGWETITWGFKLVTPSLFYPQKPYNEAGNYLGHIAGDVAPRDQDTQMSYGVMANFYNAFSILGVLIGTPLFFAAFYYWIRIFLGNPRWEREPTTSTLWFIWLLALYQHNIVEASLSGDIASLNFPVIVFLITMITKAVYPFLPETISCAEDLGHTAPLKVRIFATPFRGASRQ